MNCMKKFPVGTAEYERNYSLMNNLNTDKRAVLLLSSISKLILESRLKVGFRQVQSKYHLQTASLSGIHCSTGVVQAGERQNLH